MSDFLSSAQGFFKEYNNPIQSFLGFGQQYVAYNIKKSAAQTQINSLNMAGDLEYSGGMLSAEGYRNSKRSVSNATSYNIAQDNINVQREMQSLGRQFQRTIGEQVVATAAQGISLTSKSALMLRNETVNVYDKALLQVKLNAENNIRNQLYESRVKQSELEQQAVASEYQAKLARVVAANRAAEVEAMQKAQKKQAISGFLRDVPTLLNQLTSKGG